MSILNQYYERLLNVLQNDVDALLSVEDPAARSPKTILELLKMAGQCEEALKLVDDSADQLARLSPAAQKAIDEIIRKDLGV